VNERVLVVKLAALGDVLRTTSGLVPLKARHPGCHVTWVTRTTAVPILQGNPLIDRILAVESNYLELLLSEQFDIVIAPDAEPLSAAIAALARSNTKCGFVADGRGGVRATNTAAERWWQLGLDDVLKRENRRTYGDWLL
jgi:heptosyltransferase-2